MFLLVYFYHVMVAKKISIESCMTMHVLYIHPSILLLEPKAVKHSAKMNALACIMMLMACLISSLV